MTPTEKLLAEQEKIVAERGYYIRPVPTITDICSNSTAARI